MAIANLKTCQTQIGIEGRKYWKKISTANLKVITCNPNLLITYYLNLSQNYLRKCVFSSVTYQIRKLKWSGFFTKTSSKIFSFLHSFNPFLLHLHKYKFWNQKFVSQERTKLPISQNYKHLFLKTQFYKIIFCLQIQIFKAGFKRTVYLAQI